MPARSCPEWESVGTEEWNPADHWESPVATIPAPPAVSSIPFKQELDPQPFNPNYQAQTGITDWINLRALGARGDGKADDSPILQAANLIAQLAPGRMIYIPAGTYFTSVAVTFSSGVQWLNMGTITGGGLSGGTQLQFGNPGSGMANPMIANQDLIVGGASGSPSRLAVGTNGSILGVAGGVVAWIGQGSAGMTNPMTQPDDLIVGGVAGAPGRLGIGTNGQVLSVVGGAPTWAAPSAGTTPFTMVLASGDTTGATDTTNIQTALNAGGLVQLQAATYYINAPLAIPANTNLSGASPCTYSGDNVQGAFTGTTIAPVASFNKGSFTFPAAVFLGDGNGVSTFEGPGLWNLLVDGSNGPSGLAGIVAYGPVQAITMKNFGIWHAKADGLGLYTSSHGKPDGGNFSIGIIQSCNSGNGVVCDGADFDFDAVHSQGNHLDGFVITHANNTFRGCRADHNTNGYTTGTTATGAVFNSIRLIGCSTQGNNANGLNVTTGESTGVSLTAPVVCSGCSFQGDGANAGAGGGGFAGIAASGTVVLTLDNCSVTVDTTDAAGGSPQYALTTAAAGSGSGKPQLVQLVGGMLGSLNAAGAIPQIKDNAPATLLSASFHGYSGGPLTTGTPIAAFQTNPL